MAATFDPYHKWLGIPPAEQPPNHYRLLAINPFESDPDVIEAAADQRMVHLRSLQTGQHAEFTQRLLNQISAAKVCLLRADKKKEYDDQLRAKLIKAAPPPAPPATPPGVPPAETPPAEAPVAPAAAGPLDFIHNPAPAKSGHWEPEPLPVGSRGSRRTGVSSYSSWKKKSSQAPIFGIVAAVVVIGIAVGIYLATNANQGSSSTDQANSSGNNPATDKHPGEEPNKPKPPVHVVPPTPSPHPAKPNEPAPPKLPEPRPAPPPTTDVAVHQPEPPKPKPVNPPPKPPDNPAPAKLPPAPADTRKPVPDAAAQTKAVAQVREVLKDDFAKAITPEARAELARKLIKLASETNDDLNQRYVMGTQAMELAIKVGDADLAFQAIDGLDSFFAVDGWDLKARALQQLSHMAKSMPSRQFVAAQALSMTDSALSSDHYDAAVEMATVAVAMADALGEPVMREQAHEARSRAQRMQNVAQEFKAAKEKLAAHPDDAEANLAVGKFLCFQKGDWSAGLPFLSHGNDPALQKLAGMEGAIQAAEPDSPNVAAERMKLADAWWDAAEKIGDKKNPAVPAMFGRAKHWYQEAIPGLSGLTLERAQKRSKEEAVTEVGTVKMIYLDELPEQDASVGIGSLGKQGATGLPDGSPQTVSFRGVPVKHALVMSPPQKGMATASFTVDRRFHNLTAVVGVLDKAHPKSPITFEVRGDGSILWISRPIRRADDSQECNIAVGNYKVLQLEVHCADDNTEAWAVWINPILKR